MTAENMTQIQIDNAMDQQRNIPITIDSRGPLNINNPMHLSLHTSISNGLTYTYRELLQAIGCKTGGLPFKKRTDCYNAAYKYAYLLDLSAQNLSYDSNKFSQISSDLKGVDSQELGVGFTSLFADKILNLPVDKLTNIPGTETRFDYTCSHNGKSYIFESKGSSNYGTQISQIENGISKKSKIHQNQQPFDLELVISICVGTNITPQFKIADPDMSSYQEKFRRMDDYYRRVKFYENLLMSIGDKNNSSQLKLIANSYLNNKNVCFSQNVEFQDNAEIIQINGEKFLGKWESSYVYGKNKLVIPKLKVFSGIHIETYLNLMKGNFYEPLKTSEINIKMSNSDRRIFKNGSILLFKKDE